jgi:hypothetical protein
MKNTLVLGIEVIQDIVQGLGKTEAKWSMAGRISIATCNGAINVLSASQIWRHLAGKIQKQLLDNYGALRTERTFLGSTCDRCQRSPKAGLQIETSKKSTYQGIYGFQGTCSISETILLVASFRES